MLLTSFVAFLLAFGTSAPNGPALAWASEKGSAVSANRKAKKKRVKKSRRKAQAKKARNKRRKKSIAKKKRPRSRSIKKWQSAGLSDEEIVRKAYSRGYVHTRKTARALRKRGVRKSLRIALRKGAQKAPAADPARPIDLETVIEPNEIDFDSVPPPQGMPSSFAKKHEAAHKEAKRQTPKPAEPKAAPAPRRVIVAK